MMNRHEISDTRHNELADILEQRTGRRPTMEEEREAGENLLQVVMLLDRIDRRLKAEAVTKA